MKVVSIVLAMTVLVGGCATNTGVTSLGPDTFKIYKRGATGFVGSEAIKSDVMLQASDYCSKRGQFVQVLSEHLGSPPYIFGNFPKAEIQFKCVASAAVGSEAPNSSNGEGKVAVESSVPNAEVLVDGKFVGSAPLATLVLAAGTHTIEVTAKGYLPWKRDLTLERGATTRVMADLEVATKP
jgi:hypothetical protein